MTSQRRIHVVQLTDNLGYGGAERVALDLARRFDPQRFRSTICVTRPKPIPPARRPLLDALSREGGGFLQLDRSGRLDLAAWRPLLRLLRRERVDVLHGHMNGGSVWAAALGRLAGVPAIVAHEHGSESVASFERRLADRFVARATDAIVAVTEDERTRWIDRRRAPAGRVHVIPNAVEPADPQHAAPERLRRELGLGGDARLVGCVGALRPEKAQVVLVEAAVRLRESHPEANVVLIGGGPERAALEARVAELGLAGKVHFTGKRDDVPEVLPGLDVVVNCSDREGMPLGVLEYMSAGLPIVATAVGGVREIIDDGVHGVLVAPRDPDALAAAVGGLLDEPRRARGLGERAHARQRAEFDAAVVTRRFEELYLALLARRG